MDKGCRQASPAERCELTGSPIEINTERWGGGGVGGGMLETPPRDRDRRIGTPPLGPTVPHASAAVHRNDFACEGSARRS